MHQPPAKSATSRVKQIKGIALARARTSKTKRKYTLRQLCIGMTPAKSHPEFDWGGKNVRKNNQ
ncbi:MAG TPA: hypothetical protein VM008_04345 [Phycisphaerae bacterium]|nr:hypothetical protein [Phycisphaerae bacterium]